MAKRGERGEQDEQPDAQRGADTRLDRSLEYLGAARKHTSGWRTLSALTPDVGLGSRGEKSPPARDLFDGEGRATDIAPMGRADTS